MITGELLPTDVRGIGMSVSVGVQWIFSSVVSASFPVLRNHLGTVPTLAGYALCLVSPPVTTPN